MSRRRLPKSAPDDGSYEADDAPWPDELRVFKDEGRIEIDFTDGKKLSACRPSICASKARRPRCRAMAGRPPRRSSSGRRHVKIVDGRAGRQLRHPHHLRRQARHRHLQLVLPARAGRHPDRALGRLPGRPAVPRPEPRSLRPSMKIVIAGAGIGGLTAAMCLHARRVRRRGLRLGERAQAARRRHQHPGGRGAHPVRPRAGAGARRHRHRDARAALRQPPRPDDLGRSARPPCRPAVAAILDPSRRTADDPVRGGQEDAGRGQDPVRPPHRDASSRRATRSSRASSTATATSSRRRSPTS